MNVRREMRRRLGSRRQRREGTKTKGYGPMNNSGGGRQKFTYPRRQRPRPAAQLAAFFRKESEAESNAASESSTGASQ